MPEFILAMKCIAARYDTSDSDDVLFLIKHLNLGSVEEVLNIVAKYYPNKLVPA